MIELTYRPRGVCSQLIYVAIDDAGETIEDVAFYGGCAGNLLAITKLLKGASVDKTIELLEGNPCGPRPTSRRVPVRTGACVSMRSKRY